MREDIGNLWTYPADYRVITTNGVISATGRLVMGAGCAFQARQRFPGIDATLGNLVINHGNYPYILEELHIATLPTKGHWREPSDLEFVLRSAMLLMNIVQNDPKMQNETFVMPRPGCGLGGLNWEEQVKEPLSEILSDQFTVITFA